MRHAIVASTWNYLRLLIRSEAHGFTLHGCAGSAAGSARVGRDRAGGGDAPSGACPAGDPRGVHRRVELRKAQADGRLCVALDGDRPVGFAHVEMLAEDLPHLEELDVHPDHGRRGIGAALVRTVCEWVARSGYSEVTLTTFRAVPWNM